MNNIPDLEQKIKNAEEYLKSGVNIEGQGQFHLDDWNGNSGHPKWIKNKMIPTLQKEIQQQEKKNGKLKDKKKDKSLTNRRKSNQS